MDRLPADCQQLVRDFASGLTPTPREQALRDFWQLRPWVGEMQALIARELSLPGVNVYHLADVIGTRMCFICDNCITQRMFDIRVQYEPELLDLMWL